MASAGVFAIWAPTNAATVTEMTAAVRLSACANESTYTPHGNRALVDEIVRIGISRETALILILHQETRRIDVLCRCLSFYGVLTIFLLLQ